MSFGPPGLGGFFLEEMLKEISFLLTVLLFGLSCATINFQSQGRVIQFGGFKEDFYQWYGLTDQGQVWHIEKDMKNGQLKAEWLNASEVKAISVGGKHLIILKQDGTVWGMGQNTFGELGTSLSPWINHFIPLGISDVVKVYAGHGTTMVIKTDGSLWAAGQNSNGQFGLGNKDNILGFRKILDGPVTKVALAIRHTLVLKADGTLWGAGSNNHGQLGFRSPSNFETWTQISEAAILDCGAGREFSVYKTSNQTWWGIGNNQAAQFGLTKDYDQYSPVAFLNTPVSTLNACESTILYTDEKGRLWGLGNGTNGNLGPTTRKARNYDPIAVFPQTVHLFESVGAQTLVQNSSGSLFYLGEILRLGADGPRDDYVKIWPFKP